MMDGILDAHTIRAPGTTQYLRHARFSFYQKIPNVIYVLRECTTCYMSFVSIEPSEFKVTLRPYQAETLYITITNTTDRSIIFAVKTTNPNRYSVYPVQGVIHPGACQLCRIVLNYVSTIPEKKTFKDKFKVMSAVMRGKVRDIRDTWRRIEADPHAQVQHNKFIVKGLDLEKHIKLFKDRDELLKKRDELLKKRDGLVKVIEEIEEQHDVFRRHHLKAIIKELEEQLRIERDVFRRHFEAKVKELEELGEQLRIEREFTNLATEI